MKTTIDKAGRLVARPTAAAKDLPDVDVAVLIEEGRTNPPQRPSGSRRPKRRP